MRKQYSATYKAEIVKELLKEEKALNQVAAETGIHPTQLEEWKKVALAKLPELFMRSDQAASEARQHEQQVNELYAEIGRLTTQVNWLKKNLVSSLSRGERLALVEWEAESCSERLPLRVQAELLSLSRSSLYYQPVAPAAEEVAIKHRIDELYTAFPFYGSRRIRAPRFAILGQTLQLTGAV
jgi:putative transposase